MSSPFDPGRDSAVPGGNAFDQEADVADEHVTAVNQWGIPHPPDRLSEADYRG
jgi:hypothetical protein